VKLVVALLLAVTPIAAAPTTTAPPAASRQSDIDSQLKSLRSQVAEASAEEVDVLDRLDAARARRRDLDRRVAALDTEIKTAEAELEGAAERLGAIGADVTRTEAKFTATDLDLTEAKRELADRAVTAYIHQPSAQVASVLLERQTFRELAATRDFLRSYVAAQARSVERYRALRDDLDHERQSLGSLRDEVAAQRDVVSGHRDQLLGARTKQDALRVEVAAEEGAQKALLAEVRSRVKEFEAQIAALKKESDSIAALLRKRQAGQKLAPSGKGVLAVPVPGSITSGFGMRVHPILQTQRMHTGVDFSAGAGTPIRAAADGVVAVAGERGGYGNTVIVDHGNTLATLYAHQSRVAVGEGQKVAKGTIVGYAGSTGLATGPHLHFEVRVSGNPVDPLRYL
jgi:murein DD-endopeptidase MepM/ murein hydrolase activator NlpD